MCPCISCHKFPVIRCPSLAHLFVLSRLFETWECSSTMTSELQPMFGEPCHAALLRFTSSVTFVDCFSSLVMSLVHSRLDYGNFVLVGLPVYLQRRLQSVLNAAAHLVFRLRRYDHVMDALATLHWLPLPQHVDFKVAVMAFRVLHGLAPPAGSCCRPAQSLPTSVSIVTSTACATITANNSRSVDISSCCITPLELTPKHLHLCLPSVSVSKHFSSASLFLTLSSDYTMPSWSVQ